MVRRVVAGAAALGLAVGIAVVAGSGVGEPPVPLPVLGASAGTGATAADRGASSTGAAGVAYEVEGDLPELAGEAHAWSVGREADLARIAALAEALGFPGRCAPPTSGGGGRRRPGPRGGAPAGAALVVLAVRRRRPRPARRLAAGPLRGPGGMRHVRVPARHRLRPGVPAGGAGGPPRPRDLPSRDEAEEQAMIVLSAAGVDVAVASVRVDDLTTAWLVSADPEVGRVGHPGRGLDGEDRCRADHRARRGGWRCRSEANATTSSAPPRPCAGWSRASRGRCPAAGSRRSGASTARSRSPSRSRWW